MVDMEQVRQTFMEETSELLPELEQVILELETTPDDPELVNRAFRCLHTIKGSGNMFGFNQIAEFTHEVENVFDALRCGDLALSQEILDMSLLAKDQIQAMLFSPAEIDEAACLKVKKQIQALLATEDKQEMGKPKQARPGPQLFLFHVLFKPHAEILKTGNNPMYFLEDLQGLGTLWSYAHTEDIPQLENADPESCYIWWDLLLATQKGDDQIRDVFLFVEDDSLIEINVLSQIEEKQLKDINIGQFGRYFLQEQKSVAGLRQLLEYQLSPKKEKDEQIKLSELEEEIPVNSGEDVQKVSAQNTQKVKGEDASGSAKAEYTDSYVKVPAEKLDALMDMVGDTILGFSQLVKHPDIKDLELEGFNNAAHQLHLAIQQLQDSTMSLRLMPIDQLFQRMKRLIRDLSRSLHKSVRLEVKGEETEVDKSILDLLGDPLVHIIRNAVDHGIEDPQQRIEQGKPEQGLITLSAEQVAGEIRVTVSDDGQGLNREKILSKARALGLCQANEEPEENKIWSYIFNPGFSTNQEVSSVSGRGVGMDVVQNNLQALRGRISVESKPGQGSGIVLHIPLSLAIQEGMVVRSRDHLFLFPLEAVQEIFTLNQDKVWSCSATGKQTIYFRGEVIPFYPLSDLYAQGLAQGATDEKLLVLVVGRDEELVGLRVDEILGQEQVMCKPLEGLLSEIKAGAGSAILSSGEVAVVIDPNNINSLLAA